MRVTIVIMLFTVQCNPRGFKHVKGFVAHFAALCMCAGREDHMACRASSSAPSWMVSRCSMMMMMMLQWRRRRPGGGAIRVWRRRLHHLPQESRISTHTDVADDRLVLPRRIILIRHGESLGNVDESAYHRIPDWKVPLTPRGRVEARLAGQRIKEVVGDEPLYFYCSPYLRTLTTLSTLLAEFEDNHILGVAEEPRLSEQQFGNFQNAGTQDAKQERHRYGRFFYRFSGGESGLDVYNRVTSFISTLFRDFASADIKRPDLNMVLVTHGLTLRLFIMKFLRYSVTDFEASQNPGNCGFAVLNRKTHTNGEEFFELSERSRKMLAFPRQDNIGSLWKVMHEVGGHTPAPPTKFDPMAKAKRETL